MPITQTELGRRLRKAREARSLTQEELAAELNVSRSTIAQIELGNRAVTGLELERLAYLLGRDMRDLLGDAFEEADALSALFRAHADVLQQPGLLETLRRCLADAREITNLEELLEVRPDAASGATYPVPHPKSRWEAIQQGDRVAEEERRRLGLGVLPIGDITALLEAQGIRTARAKMPADVSGFTLSDPALGIFVLTNREHHPLRQRFSFAHEYAHCLLDRDRFGAVSREKDRDELIEVRANAFGAAFLMPEEGIHQFIASLGKGMASRLHAEIFDEMKAIRVSARTQPRSQDLQLYDVLQIANHFIVSRSAALYRMHNLHLINEADLERLRQEDADKGSQLAKQLKLTQAPVEARTHEFPQRLLGLALESLRRGAITRSKFAELAKIAGLKPRQSDQLVRDAGLHDTDAADIVLPEN